VRHIIDIVNTAREVFMTAEKILLAHGSGGKLTQQLIENIIYPIFKHNDGHDLLDAALMCIGSSRVALTTDSFVISPIFFPGGDIGKLAACGTINDLAVSGAKPLALTVGLIVEEGFPLQDFKKILVSLKATAEAAGVSVVTGDTKVVEKGNADKIYINTTGIGTVDDGINLNPKNITPGDLIVVSGPVGDHGMAIISQREGIAFQSPIISDCAALNGLTEGVLASGGILCMRDPTRGGVATTLLELAEQSQMMFEIKEDNIPVRPAVTAGCDMLGLDPLYLANEGKLVLIIKPHKEREVLTALSSHPLGKGCEIIGQVTAEDKKGRVLLENSLGVKRLVSKLEGPMLPRIC